MKRQRGGANNVNNNNNGVGVGVGVGSSSMNAPNRVEDMAVVGGAAMGKKRSKKDQGEQSNNSNKKKSVMEEEMRNNKESKEVVVIGAGDHHQHQHQHQQSSVMGWNSTSWEEYMPWVGGVDDEQMSWGTTWFPGWDMDFMGEAFTALYSDVVWDDDIWNLRKEIPIPLDANRTDD